MGAADLRLSHPGFFECFRAKQSEDVGRKTVSRRPGTIHEAAVTVLNQEIGPLVAVRIPSQEFQILGRLAVIAIPKSQGVGECSGRAICGKQRRRRKKKRLCYAFSSEIMVVAAAENDCGVAT